MKRCEMLHLRRYASGQGRIQGGMMRYGQAMSHDDKGTCCGEEDQVRSRCHGLTKVKNVLTAHVVRSGSEVWHSRSRLPVMVAARRRL